MRLVDNDRKRNLLHNAQFRSDWKAIWNENTRPIFKTKMLIYLSKANFDEKIYLEASFIFKTKKLVKCLYVVCVEIENSMLHSGP